MKKWTIEISCLLFVLLFGYAALSKLTEYSQFVAQLQESPLSRFAPVIAWLTPATEILLAVLLLAPKTRKVALYGSLLLMMVFTAYIIYILKYSADIPCSCGGILENMNWTQHLVFNIFFVLLALTTIVLLRKPAAVKQVPWRARLWYGSLGTIVLALIAGAVSVSATGIHQPPPVKRGAPMPVFSFQLMDSVSYMSTTQIPEGKPVVLVYFSPTCGHCQEELIELTQKKDSVAGTRFYFISSAPWKNVKKLYTVMQLHNFPNITVGVDTARYFYKSFRPRGTPYQVIYNKEKRLESILPGEGTISQLAALTAPLQ